MISGESDKEQLFADIGRAFAKALLDGDELAAELAVRDAIDARMTTAQIDDEIIAPALWLVGRLWARGEISVADEHLATEISLRVLALQREAQRTVQARKGRKALLAAPEGEQHTVALQMIANLMRDAGYTVLMLGPDVPPGALAECAARHEPTIVCLTATMPSASDRVMLAIHEIERGWPDAGYVLGGRGVSPRLRPRPGIHICRRVSEVVDAADAVLMRAERN
jgi:methanogenic corrinoid protein MtbC1